MSQTVSGLDLQSLALGLDLKLDICECDMSLQTVESDGHPPFFFLLRKIASINSESNSAINSAINSAEVHVMATTMSMSAFNSAHYNRRPRSLGLGLSLTTTVSVLGPPSVTTTTFLFD